MSRSAVESNTIPFIMQWGCSDIGTIEKHRGDRGMGSYASGSNYTEETITTFVLKEQQQPQQSTSFAAVIVVAQWPPSYICYASSRAYSSTRCVVVVV